MSSPTDSPNPLIDLAEQKFGQLTDADKTLFDAVARHEVANFKAATDELNDPASAEQWGTERTLKADRLVWLLTTAEVVTQLSFRGLQISGAKIEGRLNLAHATVAVPLIFNGCAFTDLLNLENSKLRVLQLKGTHVPGIQAAEMQVEGSVSLCNGFKATGKVNLRGATIGGQLACVGGTFSNAGKVALNANAANINADVFLSNGFKAEGEVNLVRATIGGQLACVGGTFSNAGQTALNADAAKIDASVFLRDGFKAEGEVNLTGATIGGQLDCSEGKFRNQHKTALTANAAKIDADVFLRNGFEAEGAVNLLRATIGGQLDCSGGMFSNTGQTALIANVAKIDADVFLSNGFEAKGAVNLLRATIGGQLACVGGTFSNAGQIALNANAAKIDAGAFLSNGFEAEGEVNLRRATIGGNLRCSDGHFLNKEGNAIDAEGAAIGGSVFLGGQSSNIAFQAEGKIIFLNATIDDRLELAGMKSGNAESMVLDLRFSKTSIFSFYDRQAEEIWIEQMKRGQLCLNGFVYNTINVSANAIKNKLLLKWLQLQIKASSEPQSDNGFALQPYEQLAAVLKANGHQEAATEVLIAKENDRRSYGGLTNLGKVWNCFLRLTIAHGYRPQRALLYSFIIMAIGWVVFDLGYKNQLMAETNDPPKPYAVFDSLVYSIDVFTPIIDFHQESTWMPDPNQGSTIPLLFFKTGAMLRGYFWFQIVAGWVLTSLWVAGFTGLVRSQK